jgi:hypothetical protein
MTEEVAIMIHEHLSGEDIFLWSELLYIVREGRKYVVLLLGID